MLESLYAGDGVQGRRPRDLREVAFFELAAGQCNQASMTELDLENYSLILVAADNPFASKAMASVK